MRKPVSLLRREKKKKQKLDHFPEKSKEDIQQTPLPHDEEKSWDDKSWIPSKVLDTPISPKYTDKFALQGHFGASTSSSAIIEEEDYEISIEPLREMFSDVLEKYNLMDDQGRMEEEIKDSEYNQESDDEYLDQQQQEQVLSKKKLRKLSQIPVSQLKQSAKYPEVVEWEDSTAKDPFFLVRLKCIRNTIPVPKHWSRKRRYLAGKRGFVKPPYELPDFLKGLGITEKRQEMLSMDAKKSQKVKAREKVHPKLGRLPLDFQKLYDAFFKHQTKPRLTLYGDLYFEGKETQGKIRDRRPGFISDELRSALGMGPLSPPPWLFAMQRLGAPPSYPLLRIPGVNAPIPPGTQWGYHPGGWGKPPASTSDSDAFLTGLDSFLTTEHVPKQKEPWGELEPEADDQENPEGSLD